MQENRYIYLIKTVWERAYRPRRTQNPLYSNELIIRCFQKYIFRIYRMIHI